MIMAHRKMEEIIPMGEYQRQGGLKEHRNRTNKYNKKRKSSTNKEQSGKLRGDRSGRREGETKRKRETLPVFVVVWADRLDQRVSFSSSSPPLFISPPLTGSLLSL